MALQKMDKFQEALNGISEMRKVTIEKDGLYKDMITLETNLKK